jgi:1-aminocyclopropane-1-carboxylate deaminase/D-cysteine desulfhydrase-like pyridoxal-dependent ACC family enzyme
MMAALPDWQPPGLNLRLPSPVEELHDEFVATRGVRLFLKRDDLIHPELPGNKWRKLKYNLAAAAESGHHTLLTFGGAYSNHIRAVAAAGRHLGFATIGVIRGEEPLPLNPTLAYARAQGMTLTYLDRTTYREKRSPAVVDALQACRFLLRIPPGAPRPPVTRPRQCARRHRQFLASHGDGRRTPGAPPRTPALPTVGPSTPQVAIRGG